jgi:hypothetical protein
MTMAITKKMIMSFHGQQKYNKEDKVTMNEQPLLQETIVWWLREKKKTTAIFRKSIMFFNGRWSAQGHHKQAALLWNKKQRMTAITKKMNLSFHGWQIQWREDDHDEWIVLAAREYSAGAEREANDNGKKNQEDNSVFPSLSLFFQACFVGPCCSWLFHATSTMVQVTFDFTLNCHHSLLCAAASNCRHCFLPPLTITGIPRGCFELPATSYLCFALPFLCIATSNWLYCLLLPIPTTRYDGMIASKCSPKFLGTTSFMLW